MQLNFVHQPRIAAVQMVSCYAWALAPFSCLQGEMKSLASEYEWTQICFTQSSRTILFVLVTELPVMNSDLRPVLFSICRPRNTIHPIQTSCWRGGGGICSYFTIWNESLIILQMRQRRKRSSLWHLCSVQEAVTCFMVLKCCLAIFWNGLRLFSLRLFDCWLWRFIQIGHICTCFDYCLSIVVYILEYFHSYFHPWFIALEEKRFPRCKVNDEHLDIAERIPTSDCYSEWEKCSSSTRSVYEGLQLFFTKWVINAKGASEASLCLPSGKNSLLTSSS